MRQELSAVVPILLRDPLKRAARAKTITEAGLPAAVLDEVEGILEWYWSEATSPDLSREQLAKVIAALENSRQLIAELPPTLRVSIATPIGARGEFAVPPVDTAERYVAALIEQAKRVHDGIRRAPGRQPDVLTRLLSLLGILWKREMPSRGITRHAWLSDDQDEQYSGPLLELVQALLDIEGIDYASRGALGRRLDALL
jgi:hypothetical protein